MDVLYQRRFSMYNKSSAFFTISVLICALGCATIFRGSKQELSIDSLPEGAEVTVGGVEYGNTPAKLKLSPKEEPIIILTKENYEPLKIQTSSGVGGGWIVLGILTFPVGLIVDAVTGCWYGFDQKHFEVDFNNSSVKK